MKNKKKNVKKIILITIIAVMVLSVVIGLLVLLIKVKEKEAKEKREALLQEQLAPKKDILSAEPFDNLMQIGTEVINLPCSYADFVATGVTLVTEGYSDSFLIDDATSVQVQMKLGDATFVVVVKNLADKVLPMSDCTVTGIYGVVNSYFSYPGGVRVGISTFDDVNAAWGNIGFQASTTTSEDNADKAYTVWALYEEEKAENQQSFTYYYCKEGINKSDVYAYLADTTGASSDIIDLGSYSYAVTFDRNSGVVTRIDADYNTKHGTDTWQTITYNCNGGTISYDILQDQILLTSDDKMTYAVEKIGGVDYIIGVGMVNNLFEVNSNLLEKEVEKETESDNYSWNKLLDDSTEVTSTEIAQVTPPNEKLQNLLVYDQYNFMYDCQVSGDGVKSLSYYGESKSDSVYFGMQLEARPRNACTIAFYLHPIDSNQKISDEAMAYMSTFRTHVLNTLEFKNN